MLKPGAALASLAIAGAVAGVACSPTSESLCSLDADCESDGVVGTCVEGFCAQTDASCGTGLVYTSGPDTGSCVPADLPDTGGDGAEMGDGANDGGDGANDGGSGDIEPPELVSAVVEGQTIRLRFSEAMANPAGIDTLAFRLSSAFYYDGYYGMPETRYADAGRQYAYDYGDFVTVDSVVIDSDDAEFLMLELSESPVEICAMAFSTRDLYPHYRQPDQNPIADLAGNPLPDIGAHWVEDADLETKTVEGNFPMLMPRVPIVCP